ncbi:MAG TPA: tail fiber domain-containing protein [Verrucomicrobiae bacterium]
MNLMKAPATFSFPFAIRATRALLSALLTLALFHDAPRTFGQGTAFTYQGGLNEGSAPANGSFDFVFSLYNDPLAGSQIGVSRTNLALAVSDGLFTTTLDFTGAPWNGQALWLQVLMRTNGMGAFSVLTPRQAFTSTPYAIQSLNAATAGSASSVAATNLSGTVPVQALPNIPLSGDVTGMQAATVVARVGGQSATNIANAVIAANAASTTNVPGTIVLRDNSGNFNAGSISVTSISGNGSGLIFLNPASLFPGTAAINISGNASTAKDFTDSLVGDVIGIQSATVVASVGGQSSSNIASGVVAANSATSADEPGTIVLRDGSGNFAAGAIFASSLAGDGGALTNLNPASLVGGTAGINISGSASNVTGNIADFQLSTNVALLNGSNLFSGIIDATNAGNVFIGTFSGSLSGNAQTANDFTGSLAGDVIGIQSSTIVTNVGGQSSINIANGVVAANSATSADLPGTIVLRDASGNFAAGAIFASSLAGDGGALTNLNPANLIGGTAAINISGSAASVSGGIADSQLSTNVPQLNGTNLFAGTNVFAGVTVATNGNNVFSGAFIGSLSGNALTATSATQANTAITANNFSGSLLGQVVGTQGATTVVTVGGQSATSVASGASAANSATSLSTVNTIVKRDASGNFSAGTITANFNGNGASLTNLSAAQLNFGANGNVDVGTAAVSGHAGTVRIGAAQTNAFIAGIYGATAASGVPVFITSSNQLGTLTSSRRFKEDIRTMDEASDTLLALHPVTFRYKPEIDPGGVPQFGLVAEEVEKVNPDLVAHDNEGRPYTVRYEAVNAMLLNEFLKEHRKVEAQTAKIDELTQRLERLEKAISESANQK